MRATVYCSGSIIKSADQCDKICWTDVERSALAAAARPLEVRFLNPDDSMKDMSNTRALFGRDMYQVQLADFVVVDARERRGIGVGIEIAFARVFGTPLVAVAPAGSYYRSGQVTFRGATVDDYIHPHLFVLADEIVESFDDAGQYIKEQFGRPRPIGSTEAVNEAISAYQTDLLPEDPPMQEILSTLGVSRRVAS